MHILLKNIQDQGQHSPLLFSNSKVSDNDNSGRGYSIKLVEDELILGS